VIGVVRIGYLLRRLKHTGVGGTVDIAEQWHAAAEQLYDEILARTWSLHQLDPGLGGNVDAAAVRACAAATAVRVVGRLLEGSASEERRWLSVLLWSGSAPPDDADGWWSTPLGCLLRTPRLSPSQRYPSPSAA
jgi:hypothetical protein